MILIVTCKGDLHADVLTPIVKAKGEKVFRLDLDRFPRDYQFHFGIQPSTGSRRLEGTLMNIPSREQIKLSDVTAVWMRKSADYSYLDEELSEQERLFGKYECEHTIMSVLYSLDCYWMSHPMYLRGSQWKGEQLQRAANMGFNVPASVISNQPEEVKGFMGHCLEGMIFKTMSTPTLAADEVSDEERVANGLPTTVVDDEMADNLDSVRYMPCHFQEYIPKQYELRVTVIGEHIFAAKIHSQDDERTRTDFRDYSAEILYEKAELPELIAERCLQFVHSYGLNYGAIDLIVTPDEEYVFLENNPAGQFWFVQELVPELRMMETMADTLIKGNS